MSEVGRVLPCSAIHFRFVVTLRSSESPCVSLQWVCTCDAPLPSFGSRRPRFPAVISTMRALRPPDLRPFGLFVRQPVPWRPAGGLCIRSRAPAIRAETDGGPGSIVFCRHSLSGRLSPTDKAGSPKFPGEPSRGFATIPRPRADPSRLALDGASGAAPTVWKMKASTLCISRLNSVALPPAVYASRRAIATRPCNTHFQLTGCVFAGRESNPLARDERFQLISTSFPCIPLSRASLGATTLSIRSRFRLHSR